jgi:hypothetical protein
MGWLISLVVATNCLLNDIATSDVSACLADVSVKYLLHVVPIGMRPRTELCDVHAVLSNADEPARLRRLDRTDVTIAPTTVTCTPPVVGEFMNTAEQICGESYVAATESVPVSLDTVAVTLGSATRPY